MEILKLKPIFKDYIWGGTKLREDFGFSSPLSKLAEGWMLSCHKDGECTVEVNGKEITLSEYLKAHNEYLGENSSNLSNFPILIKLIDAKENLSIQVHPDDLYAMKNEQEYGKTECWYIIDCDDNAEIVYGFNKDVTYKEFDESIKNNTLTSILNKMKIKKGDFIFIEPGTIHAIGNGILLAEIQQNSNTTYRVYDYNRIGNDGKPRPLHIEKAVNVINFNKQINTDNNNNIKKTDNYIEQTLCSCKYFNVKKVSVNDKYVDYATNKSFVSVLIINGQGEIDNKKIKKGDSLFIPSNYGKFTLSGNLDAIITTV